MKNILQKIFQLKFSINFWWLNKNLKNLFLPIVSSREIYSKLKQRNLAHYECFSVENNFFDVKILILWFLRENEKLIVGKGMTAKCA